MAEMVWAPDRPETAPARTGAVRQPHHQLMELLGTILEAADDLGRVEVLHEQVDDAARRIRRAANEAVDVVRGSATVVDLSESGAAKGLSERELEVLSLVARGTSTQQIADRLYLSVHTVRNHLNRIFRKLEVHSRIEAVATASRLGLVEVG